MHPLTPLLLRAAVVLSAMSLALCACAPASYMPPPVPLAKGEVIFGGTGTAGASNLNHKTASFSDLTPFEALQVWGGVPITDGLIAYGAVFHGRGDATGGGVGLRQDLLQTERSQLGVQASVGWLYASLGFPISVELSDPLTLYTRPTVNTVTDDWMGWPSPPLALHLPVGLWWWSPSREIGLGVELGAQGYKAHMGAIGYQPQLLGYLSVSLGSSRMLTPDSAAR